MGRRGLTFLASIAALSLASNADARGLLGGSKIVLKAGRLADALRDLSVRSGSDLLFAPDVVENLRNKRLVGALDVEPLLARLLEGTGLGYRRVGDGVYIVFRLEPDQPTALPEVLVIGRKTQNADIRRTENDIQAYRVATSEDIRSSHADNLDQFLRSRQPNNAEREGPSTDAQSQYAANRSELNLHGLGPSQTLVLVDGARMPSAISQFYELDIYQPDLNGLPLLAIDRIESLTGTAGGIYGPGATGGVVNVILKRDYRGAEVSTTFGVTGRGDGLRRRFDGRIGFTPDDGATDVMINVSRAETDGLRAGDRDYAMRRQRLIFSQNPTDSWNFPVIDGVLFSSRSGAPLTLSPALGGASLGSSFTYLQTGHSGVGDGSILLANAGRLPDKLPPDGNGKTRTLVSATTVTSLLLNARHRFGDRAEVFIDFIGYENEGRAVLGQPNYGLGVGAYRGTEDLGDSFPFQEPVSVSLALPGFDATVRNRLRTMRASIGAIVSLPGAWRGEFSYSTGATRNRVRQRGFTFSRNFSLAFPLMQPGLDGEPTPNPFAPWDEFARALEAYRVPDNLSFERTLRLRDFNVRLGGPLLKRDAGDVALSLQAERREEKAKVPAWDVNGASDISPLADPSFSVTTSSVYGELRAPIVSRDSSVTLLRGLEMQLAARHDSVQADIPGDQLSVTHETIRIGYSRAGTLYTAGLRVFPWDSLLLRGSVATGALPPTPQQMSSGVYTVGLPQTYVSNYADPARGGIFVGAEKPAVLVSRGSANLLPEQARTLAIGFVVNPDGGRGPRISLDYTHTEKRGEIIASGGVEYILANEVRYPDRIVRDPLTPNDIAAGYTGGVITRIDATFMNAGRTTVDAVDLHVDQGFHLGRGDRLRLRGSLTWTPRLTRRIVLDGPSLHYVDTDDGPLRWRGNAGATWDHGDLTVGIDAQYYDDYYATGSVAFLNRKTTGDLPGYYIPAQVYLDATAAYRLQVGQGPDRSRDVEIRFGVQNLLGRDPPIVANSQLGYSFYGDPRGRRFELSVSARF